MGRKCYYRRRGRGRLVLRGKGDFSSFVSNLWGGIKKAGSWLWDNRDTIGGVAKAAMPLFGAGDYRRRRGRRFKKRFQGNGNSMRYLANVPKMHMGADGTIRIRHHECNFASVILNIEYHYLLSAGAPFSAGSGYTPIYVAWNPAQQTFGAWVSRLAQLFTHWVPKGIALQFRSTSGENTSNPAVGILDFYSQYDMFIPPFYNSADPASVRPFIESSQYTNTGKPSRNLFHGIECAGRQLPVRMFPIHARTITYPGPAPNNGPNLGNPINNANFVYGDANLSFLGYTVLAGGGCSANATPIGDIWNTYDIVLKRPNLGATLALKDNTQPLMIVGETVYTSNTASLLQSGPPVLSAKVMGAEATIVTPPIWLDNTLNAIPLYGFGLGDNVNTLSTSTMNGMKFPSPYASQEIFLMELTIQYGSPTSVSNTSNLSMTAFGDNQTTQFVTNYYPPSGSFYQGVPPTTSTSNLFFQCVIQSQDPNWGFFIDGITAPVFPVTTEGTTTFTIAIRDITGSLMPSTPTYSTTLGYN